MNVLAIVNQKGGVGKTTTAVTLAHGLALAGCRVLLVDLDAQGSCAVCLGLGKRGGLYELLFGKAAPSQPPPEAGGGAICLSGRDGLDVVLSDKSTEKAKIELVGLPFRERVLAARLERLSQWYSVCILDAAPGVDVLQVSALAACDAFLIPVALDHLAAVGAADMLASVTSLQAMGAFRGRFLGVLPTMWERRTNESDEQLRMLLGTYRSMVWPPIPVDVKAREAPAYGKTLWEYAPKTRAIVGVAGIGGYAAVLARLRQEVGL